MKAKSPLELVGNTPTVEYVTPETPGARIWVKLEGNNPTGSVKDRGCVSIIRGAEARGDLRPGMTLLDASSGNMACSMAYFGRVLGYPVTVVCNSKLTEEKAAYIKYFGGELSLVGDFTIQGNIHCRDVLYPEDPDRYCFWRAGPASQLGQPQGPFRDHRTGDRPGPSGGRGGGGVPGFGRNHERRRPVHETDGARHTSRVRRGGAGDEDTRHRRL